MDIPIDSIQIIARPGPEGDTCVFHVNRQLTNTRIEGSRGMNGLPPFAAEFLALEGIGQILIQGDDLMVAQSGGRDWTSLAKQIGGMIRHGFASGQLPIRLSSPTNATHIDSSGADTSGLFDRLQKALDEEINPAIASHRGRITIEAVRDGQVWVRMSGGCQGCGSAQQTLKQGVERVLLSRFPEVREVSDITDHASGTDPFFK